MKPIHIPIFIFIIASISSFYIFTSLNTSNHLKYDELYSILSDPHYRNFRRLSKQPKYPIICSSSIPPADSDTNDFIKSMDVLEISDNRYYVMIHDGWEHFESQVMVPDMKVEEDMTADLHEVPDPYTSSYFISGRSKQPIYPTIQEPYDCYRSVEGSYQTMDFLASEYPSLVDVIDIGPTYLKSIGQGGREMKVLKLTNKNSTAVSKAPMFVLCSIHPRELAPTEACARFAEDMLEEYGKDADKTWILDHTEIHMVLQGNPDAREDEEEFLHYRRKNMNLNNGYVSCMCRNLWKGVDMNRNFPHSKWGSTEETGECGQSYPGRSAGSEKETQAIVNHMESVLPPGTNNIDKRTGAYTANSQGVLMDIHTYGNMFLWPYSHNSDLIAPNNVDLTAFAKKMASFTVPEYKTDNEIYEASGDATDWAYEAIGVAPITVEIGWKFHESCGTFENINLVNAMNSLLYAARVTHAPYQLPKGPDIVDIKLSSAILSTTDVLLITASMSDRAHALGFETGNQRLDHFYLFIDNHPYDDDASPIVEMKSGFSSSEATVETTISFLGFSPGQHTLYFQAFDVDGPGPVYAKFIELIE